MFSALALVAVAFALLAAPGWAKPRKSPQQRAHATCNTVKKAHRDHRSARRCPKWRVVKQARRRVVKNQRLKRTSRRSSVPAAAHALTSTAAATPAAPATSTTGATTTAGPTPAPVPAPPPEPSREPQPAAGPDPGPVYWGAWIGSHLTGDEAPWDTGAIDLFERNAGKRLSLVNFSSPFANCYSLPCRSYAFPAGEFSTIRNRGAIPFFSWANNALPVTHDQPDYQLADVLAGRHDNYITAWATAARNWGHPFFLRFNWEMNGRWFPWSEGVNGNRPGEYIAAWRHVHDIFSRVGATNTTWVWCPNVDPGKMMQPLSEVYPGDEYVDWTCLDGYNWNTPRMSFHRVFKSTYDSVMTIAPSKPMIIGETGTTEAGGSKAQWIDDMFESLPVNFPNVRGLQWFDKYDDGMDWPIETSTAATAAFAAGIRSPRYTTNSYSRLTGLTPVAAPSS